MAFDRSDLANATLAANALSGIILVTPQMNIGIKPQFPDSNPEDDDQKSFLFDYEGENSVTLESDITDHYVEDNTAIQDQIALKPEKVVTTGYIGELNNVTPKDLRLLKLASQKLTVLQPYVPALSATAIIAYNTAAQAYAVAQSLKNTGVAAWATITGAGQKPVQTKQQLAFTTFYGYYQNRQLFTVQTPWAIFKDMAIVSLRAIQDEDTRFVSSFEITFKRMRFAQTITLDTSLIQQGRAVDQASSIIDHGVSKPVPDIGLSSQLRLVA